METKKCSKCKEVKAVSEFNKNKTKKIGLQSECKSCANKCNKQYYQQNKEKKREYNKNYDRQRRHKDEIYNTRRSISVCIRKYAINHRYSQRSRLNHILGLSCEEFKKYFESKFAKGMTWDNYGEWEVDHIIPISKATTIEEVIELNHYTNLQPLWKHHNMSKGTASYEVEYK